MEPTVIQKDQVITRDGDEITWSDDGYLDSETETGFMEWTGYIVRELGDGELLVEAY